MSPETCCIDGRPFGKLEREFVCVVCARKVCGEHSTDSRINPFTGERGHACRRCLGETVEGTLEAQVAALYRQLHTLGPELKALTAEVQALRQAVTQVTRKPAPRPRTPRSQPVAQKSVAKKSAAKKSAAKKSAAKKPAAPVA